MGIPKNPSIFGNELLALQRRKARYFPKIEGVSGIFGNCGNGGPAPLLPAAPCAHNQPGRAAHRRRQHPAEPFGVKRQPGGGPIHNRLHRRRRAGRQRAQKFQHRGRRRAAQPAAQHGAVIAIQRAGQRQQDQHNGQRIQRHEHRLRPGQDGVQAKVRDQKREQAEPHRPHPVGGPVRKDFDKGFAAAGNQADRRFQAGDGHRCRQDQRAGAAEVGRRDLGQRFAAVGRRRKPAAALRADKGKAGRCPPSGRS